MIKIIGLIDGSIYAQSVCDHIAWIAGRSEVSVDILHVIGRRDLSTEPVNLSGNIGLGARTALLAELAELDAQKQERLNTVDGFCWKRQRRVFKPWASIASTLCCAMAIWLKPCKSWRKAPT